MAKHKIWNWVKRNAGIIITVLLVSVSFGVIFGVALPVNVNNMGGTHSWLSGSTIKFVDYWLEEGAASLNYTNYENPASIEFNTLEEREPYLSYPSGETFFVYLAARVTGRTSISISFLHKFQLLMFLIEAILMACFVYYLMARTVKCKKELVRVPVAVLTALIWMLMPTCAYYLANIYYADQCVILWIMGLILIEYLFRTSKKEKRTGLKILRSAVLYSGMLIDYYFWFLAGLIFVVEIANAVLANEKGKRKKEVVSILLWFGIPVVLAILTYFIQLTRTDGWLGIMMGKFGERVVGENQTSEWIFNAISNNFVQAFSLDASMVNYLIIGMSVVLVAGVVVMVKKQKLASIIRNPGVSLIICNVLAILLQIFVFKQHSAIHEFSMIKVAWVVAMLPIVATLVFGYMVNARQKLDVRIEKEILLLFLANCLVVMLAVGVPVSTERFINNRVGVQDFSMEGAIRGYTDYEDVVFSYSRKVDANPPQALAMSHKRVYKVDNIDEIKEKMRGVGENAKTVLVIDKEAEMDDERIVGQEACLAKTGEVRWADGRYQLIELEDINKCKVEEK